MSVTEDHFGMPVVNSSAAAVTLVTPGARSPGRAPARRQHRPGLRSPHGLPQPRRRAGAPAFPAVEPPTDRITPPRRSTRTAADQAAATRAPQRRRHPRKRARNLDAGTARGPGEGVDPETATRVPALAGCAGLRGPGSRAALAAARPLRRSDGRAVMRRCCGLRVSRHCERGARVALQRTPCIGNGWEAKLRTACDSARVTSSVRLF